MIVEWFKKRKSKKISSAEFDINREMLSKHALKTIKLLQSHGYKAYVVGGAVRDGILGFNFKDIDLATDASPEAIRRLFKRKARIIGRRFPIVHVYPPRHFSNNKEDILEVTTFRADKKDTKITRDNAEAQDALRRDFSANALYYEPFTETIIDHVGSLKDLKARQLKFIGKPRTRLQEDPVRLLRALRLSEKLGLEIQKDALPQFSKLSHLLSDIPRARLFDEVIKTFHSGACARIMKQWKIYHVDQHILPVLQRDNPLFFSIAADNDRRCAENRERSLSFLLAALFWQETHALWQQHKATAPNNFAAMQLALSETSFRANNIIPKQIIGRIKDIFVLQERMESASTLRAAHTVTRHRYFDRALCFATHRFDEQAAQTASWWSQFIATNASEQKRMISLIPKKSRKKK